MPRPERSFRTPGIILKRHNYAEADRVLTILTPNHGKLSVIAKGARKPTSSKTGHVELFTVVDMLVSRGRTFDILTQVEVQQPFLPLREDIQRGAYASYVAELMDRFVTQGDEDFADAFDLLAETFERLCSEVDVRLVTRYYELNLLSISGFQPELNHCVMTGDEIQPQDQYFSFAEGGVVSPQGAQHGSTLVSLSLPVLKLLRHMQRSPFSQVQALQITLEIHQDLERLILGFITYILESRLQSVDFIRKIRAQ